MDTNTQLLHELISKNPGPIGVFDSGYGGLTILEKIRDELPQYDYIYLGDNARSPYGTRSFEIVYDYTKQAVCKLFELGCQLVILACNTASAKALRTIQMNDLPIIDPDRRVLGVIRPTVESVGKITKSGHVGVLATVGTINSESYPMEIKKLFPEVTVVGEACPMWVPIVENNESMSDGADFFVKKSIQNILARDPQLDTLVLGCTHYPLLIPKIERFVPDGIQIIAQGEYVAKSLENYLYRHPDLESKCTKRGQCKYYTTESTDKFRESASVFLKSDIDVEHIVLG